MSRCPLSSARLIQSVAGFGVFLSVLVAMEIEDIRRFKDVSKLYAYAGVILSTHGSGVTLGSVNFYV